MAGWKEPWVWQIRDLGGPRRATQLLETARDHADRELILDLTEVQQVYPNGAVPFAAALAFLRETTSQRITVRMPDDSRVQHIETPLTVGSFDRWGGDTLTHSVWRYDTESDAQKLTNMFMEALTQCRVA